MKIAFIGAPSTGKSTLSARVAQELNLPHIPEVVPLAMKETGITADDLVRGEGEDLVLFQEAMFRNTKAEEAKQGLSFVQDSALLEVEMYLQYFCLRYMTIDKALEMYDDAITHSCKNYDIIFHLPSGILPIVDNGFRNTNPQMNQVFDAMLRQLMEDARKRGANIKTVMAIPLEHRVGYVISEVSRMVNALFTYTPPNWVVDFTAPAMPSGTFVFPPNPVVWNTDNSRGALPSVPDFLGTFRSTVGHGG